MLTLGIDIGGSSIKAACTNSDGCKRTATSQRYTNPDRSGLISAIQSCVAILEIDHPVRVGLCLPGRMHADRQSIELAINLPVLNDWAFEDIITSAFDHEVVSYRVISDAEAAGFDFAVSHRIAGRTAAISIGTGVGLCVLDGTQIVTIGKKGIGQIGDMHIGLFGGTDRMNDPYTANTPESYFSAPALQNFNTEANLDLTSLTGGDPAIQALAHTLKVVHAVYMPERIALLGGVGIAFRPHAELIKDLVDDGLTQLAVQDWSLDFATSAYHAALGAAKLATQHS
jgi:predicted NBD/HSP70 family sugar kinase